MHKFLSKNQPKLKRIRRALRRKATYPEHALWQRLRQEQLGIRFRRQHSIGSFVVDFYAPTIGVAIEIDGDSHYESARTKHRDRARDERLARDGIHVLRFTNDDVVRNMEGVCERIAEIVQSRIRMHDPSPPVGRGG